MSVASPPPSPPSTGSAGALGASGSEPVADSCPLCGAPLDPEQEWCLRCGAAARTRLAASSNWKAPIIAFAVVATLSLGVLAAALVTLAGGSSSTTNVTTTVTRPAAVTSPGTATITPAPSTPAPSTSAPGAATPGASTPGAVAPAVGLGPVTALSPSAATVNGTVNPQGVPTTYQFLFRKTASHGWSGAAAPVPLGAGTAVIAVNSRIVFLTPGTTYRYKLTASKAGRAVTTPAATFTTPGPGR